MVPALPVPCEGAVVHAREHAAARTRARQKWTLAATILGASRSVIDGNVVNLALPAVQESLGAGSSVVQWVVEIYTLALSSLVLVGGALGDHFGRRRLFAIGIGGFAAASVACGLAESGAQLIAARA